MGKVELNSFDVFPEGCDRGVYDLYSLESDIKPQVNK